MPGMDGQRKYAMWERGELLPSQKPSPLMTCPCGEVFDSHNPEGSYVHREHITAALPGDLYTNRYAGLRKALTEFIKQVWLRLTRYRCARRIGGGEGLIMSTITVHAGHFVPGKCNVWSGSIRLKDIASRKAISYSFMISPK